LERPEEREQRNRALKTRPERDEMPSTQTSLLEEHHRRKTFQEEYAGLLKVAVIEYDQRYL